MSSNLIKVIAAVLVLLAVVLGVWAYKMSHDFADASNKAAPPAQPQAPVTAQIPEIIVAKHPLMADQPIKADDVKIVSMDKDIAPVGYYTLLKEVVGRSPRIDIDAGQPVTPRLFGEIDQVAKLVPPGHKAVSLVLTDVIGVGGFMRPGDIVDVMVFLRNDQSNKVDPAQARILLRDALVLASDDRVVNPPASNDDSQLGKQGQQQTQQQQQQRHERTVVVAVPDDQVSRVMLGASMGDVRLALHGTAQEVEVASATVEGAAAAPSAAAGAPPAAPTSAMPTAVSGASMAEQKPVAAAAKPGAADQLADMPYTSEELAKLRPKHAVGKGTPQGIVIYRGSKASTVYP